MNSRTDLVKTLFASWHQPFFSEILQFCYKKSCEFRPFIRSRVQVRGIHAKVEIFEILEPTEFYGVRANSKSR